MSMTNLIINNSNKQIGYFSTSDQVIYGKIKNKIIYRVKIFYSNKSYLVSYGGKLRGKLVVIVQENNLDPMRAAIVDVIGLMHDAILVKTLQHIFNIYRKNTIIDPVFTNILKVNDSTECIFSIDPPDCLDIDDAMSFIKSRDYTKVVIYIAQPTRFLSENILMTKCTQQFSTLYNIIDKNDNLWGNTITYNASFIPHTPRYAICIEFVYDKYNNNISTRYYYDTICNKYKTTYDNCFDIPNIKECFNFTKLLVKDNKHFNINDSHDLVSYWMIQTNTFMGNTDIIKTLDIPYRTLKSNAINCNIENDFVKIENTKIRQLFREKSIISSKYTYNDNLNYHSKLNVYNYVHFTSPIRRSIDALIHWCIYNNKNFKVLLSEYNVSLDEINILAKNTNNYHKTMQLLSINIPNDFIELYGYVYKMNKEDRTIWTIYFEQLGFQKVKLCDKKFIKLYAEQLYNISIGDKMKFRVYKVNGFLPQDKIAIIPID